MRVLVAYVLLWSASLTATSRKVGYVNFDDYAKSVELYERSLLGSSFKKEDKAWIAMKDLEMVKEYLDPNSILLVSCRWVS